MAWRLEEMMLVDEGTFHKVWRLRLLVFTVPDVHVATIDPVSILSSEWFGVEVVTCCHYSGGAKVRLLKCEDVVADLDSSHDPAKLLASCGKPVWPSCISARK
jgi:hypothetical protein